MTPGTGNSLERARSMIFAVLSILTLALVVFNVTNDPTGSNIVCFSGHGDVDALLTIGLWVLAISASLGALSATYHELQPTNTYKRVLVWLVYIASVPALFLLPSSETINGAVGQCATSNFYTYLTWYMMGVIAAAALTCIHLLVHEQRHQKKRAEASLSSAADSSASLQASQQEKQDQLASTMLQLRSPLTNLRVQIESLLEENSDQNKPESQAALQEINTSATSMSRTIETHLDLIKLESNNLELAPIDLNLRDTTETICDELRPAVLKKGLILLLRSNLTTQSIVHADRVRLNQILRTMIDHAYTSTNRGTITAFVRDVQAAKKVYVDIIDTGAGYSKAELAQLFSVGSTGQTNQNLRLTLAKRLATSMGGNITAHSEGKGKGSRLTLVLPLHL